MKIGKLFCLLCVVGLFVMPSWSTRHNELSEMKQELALAQKKLMKQKAYVDQLEEDIARYEIERIQKEISQIDQEESFKLSLTQEQWLTFFYQQREILGTIMRNHPACRGDAQEVLDQILSIITQLSDNNE